MRRHAITLIISQVNGERNYAEPKLNLTSAKFAQRSEDSGITECAVSP